MKVTLLVLVLVFPLFLTGCDDPKYNPHARTELVKDIKKMVKDIEEIKNLMKERKK